MPPDKDSELEPSKLLFEDERGKVTRPIEGGGGVGSSSMTYSEYSSDIRPNTSSGGGSIGFSELSGSASGEGPSTPVPGGCRCSHEYHDTPIFVTLRYK